MHTSKRSIPHRYLIAGSHYLATILHAPPVRVHHLCSAFLYRKYMPCARPIVCATTCIVPFIDLGRPRRMVNSFSLSLFPCRHSETPRRKTRDADQRPLHQTVPRFLVLTDNPIRSDHTHRMIWRHARSVIPYGRCFHQISISDVRGSTRYGRLCWRGVIGSKDVLLTGAVVG